MITVYLQGGLGNQLFQIFACISYALKYNFEFKLPLYNQNEKDAKGPAGHSRPTYWNSLFVNLKNHVLDNNLLYKKLLGDTFSRLPQLREKDFCYNEIPKINASFMLFGYFQSYKYFQDNFDKISEIIKIERFKNIILEKNKDLFIYETISMHFRLGDYKNLSAHNIMPINYYIDALSEIIKKTNKNDFTVVFFCEDEDIEHVEKKINQIKQTHTNCVFKRGKGEDWEELILMSLCNHNIIANSSFSWWGAYLNKNPDKVVCRPKNWFSENYSKNTSDLCPNNWIKI